MTTTASCLAHRERIFWQPPWSCWVHAAGCQPCDALAGEPDPEALHCRYCGVRVKADGAGRLLEFTGQGSRWEHTGQTVAQGSVWSGGWEYIDGNWTGKCPVSPTFLHHVGPLRFTGVKQAG